jgi:hypothetical protein
MNQDNKSRNAAWLYAMHEPSEEIVNRDLCRIYLRESLQFDFAHVATLL